MTTAHTQPDEAFTKLLDVAIRWDYYRPSILAKYFDANSPTLTMLLDDTREAINDAKAALSKARGEQHAKGGEQ